MTPITPLLTALAQTNAQDPEGFGTGRTMQMFANRPEATVGWGTLALINAGIAQGKNRSGLAWFLVSIFLGPLATFILVAFCEKLPSEE